MMDWATEIGIAVLLGLWSIGMLGTGCRLGRWRERRLAARRWEAFQRSHVDSIAAQLGCSVRDLMERQPREPESDVLVGGKPQAYSRGGWVDEVADV